MQLPPVDSVRLKFEIMQVYDIVSCPESMPNQSMTVHGHVLTMYYLYRLMNARMLLRIRASDKYFYTLHEVASPEYTPHPLGNLLGGVGHKQVYRYYDRYFLQKTQTYFSRLLQVRVQHEYMCS